MGERKSDARITEIRGLLAEWDARREAHGFGGPDGVDNPFTSVIENLPEFDGDATEAAGIREEQDIYLLTDGTRLDGDGHEGWDACRPGEWPGP